MLLKWLKQITQITSSDVFSQKLKCVCLSTFSNTCILYPQNLRSIFIPVNIKQMFLLLKILSLCLHLIQFKWPSLTLLLNTWFFLQCQNKSPCRSISPWYECALIDHLSTSWQYFRPPSWYLMIHSYNKQILYWPSLSTGRLTDVYLLFFYDTIWYQYWQNDTMQPH